MLKPRVARYNGIGVHVSLENTGDTLRNSCSLLLLEGTYSPNAACRLAAVELRKVAEALDILAEHESPFREESVLEVMHGVSRK